MELSYTSLFYRSYGKLTPAQQEQIDEAIRRFCSRPNPPYPRGWRVHKLHGVKGTAEADDGERPDVWEMHAPGQGALIVTFQFGRDSGIMFRNCGLHDETLQAP